MDIITNPSDRFVNELITIKYPNRKKVHTVQIVNWSFKMHDMSCKRLYFKCFLTMENKIRSKIYPTYISYRIPQHQVFFCGLFSFRPILLTWINFNFISSMDA